MQKEFSLFALRDLRWRDRFSIKPYINRLMLLNIIPLSKRHRQELIYLMFIHDVVNYMINSPQEISFQFMFRDSAYGLRRQAPLLLTL